MMILKARTKEPDADTETETFHAQKKAKLLRDAVENTELESVSESQAASLSISNSERYCHGPTMVQTTDDKSDTMAEGGEESVGRFKQAITEWKADLSSVSAALL